jgi:hypothetical protein
MDDYDAGFKAGYEQGFGAGQEALSKLQDSVELDAEVARKRQAVFSTASAELDKITVVETDDSMVRLQLDIPDELYAKLIAVGRREITADDYASVAITNAVLKGFEKEKECCDGECGC